MRSLKVVLLMLVLGLAALNCDPPPSNDLSIQHSESAFVVPGPASNCVDFRESDPPYPQSLSADSFQISTFKLIWNGKNDLYPYQITITASHPFLASDINCTIDNNYLVDAFGEPPIPAGTTDDMNDPAKGFHTCGIGCGGLTKKTGYENASFSTTATVTFKGYSQDSDGSNQKPVKVITHVKLNF